MSDPLWGVMVQERDAEIARLRAEVERLTQERDALAARLGEAEGLLRAVQWPANEWDEQRCSFCGNAKEDGHAPNCTLAAFLAAGEQDNGKETT